MQTHALVDDGRRRIPVHSPAPDDTYRRLLGPFQWRRLKPEVRARFSSKPIPGTDIRYVGNMKVRHSFFGALFAQACRLIGTPLSPYAGNNALVDVALSADRAGGVEWRRRYRFSWRREALVSSTKRLNARGVLEEHVGGGFSMQLKVFEQDGNLHFLSEDYHWRLGRWKVRLPALLTPGVTHVIHEQVSGERFRFVLRVTHPLLGETFYQEGEFVPAPARMPKARFFYLPTAF